jgi:hypothetical protein
MRSFLERGIPFDDVVAFTHPQPPHGPAVCRHRVESCGPVGNPTREGIPGGGGGVADMNAPVIKIEVEYLWVVFAAGERCCGFGGVGEAMQLGQADGPGGVGEVAEGRRRRGRPCRLRR